MGSVSLSNLDKGVDLDELRRILKGRLEEFHMYLDRILDDMEDLDWDDWPYLRLAGANRQLRLAAKQLGGEKE